VTPNDNATIEGPLAKSLNEFLKNKRGCPKQEVEHDSVTSHNDTTQSSGCAIIGLIKITVKKIKIKLLIINKIIRRPEFGMHTMA